MPNKILVIGATGMLGEPVARQLHAGGSRLRPHGGPSLRHAGSGQQDALRSRPAALPFFRYTEQVTEAGDPAEANALLGAPITTLEQWCQRQGAQE